MKQVIAYIKPLKLENAMLELHKIKGLSGVSVLEMRGCGHSHKDMADAIFDEDSYSLASRLKLEVACSDEQVEQVVTAIQEGAHTGLKGDGKIYVLPVLEAVRISNGEIGDKAV